MNTLLLIILAVFGVAAILAVIRIVRGPSILGAEMAINGHTRNIPVLLIIAAVGVFGSIAVARFVARRDNTTP